MIDRDAILRRLDPEPGTALVQRIRDWLGRGDTRLVSDRISKVSVSEAMRLWTTRLQNTDITGQHLYGAEPFLERLKSLTPQRKLEQYALTGPDLTGNLFFDPSTHHLVGAVLFDTPKRNKLAN